MSLVKSTVTIGGYTLLSRILGFARDVTFGTAFSASIEQPAGSAYLYVLSTRSELIEVQADLTGPPGGRATRIYEQLIRSITPT